MFRTTRRLLGSKGKGRQVPVQLLQHIQNSSEVAWEQVEGRQVPVQLLQHVQNSSEDPWEQVEGRQVPVQLLQHVQNSTEVAWEQGEGHQVPEQLVRSALGLLGNKGKVARSLYSCFSMFRTAGVVLEQEKVCQVHVQLHQHVPSSPEVAWEQVEGHLVPVQLLQYGKISSQVGE